MRILIVEDNRTKSLPIEEATKAIGMEAVNCFNLSSAIDFLKNNTVDGIVTDKSYPINEGEKENSTAGIQLLEWLNDHKKKIPVLGNSMSQFSTEYPFYKGKMNGFFSEDIFLDFISKIEENHN